MAKSAKSRLHKMLLKRGLGMPVYDRTTEQKANVATHYVTATLAVGNKSYEGKGTGPSYVLADEQAADAILTQVIGHLRHIPEEVQLHKGHGSWEELYQAGDYSAALKRYCSAKKLDEPKVEHVTRKKQLFTGGKSAGRMGSVGQKRHDLKVTVGTVVRTANHPKERVAIMNACKSVLDELIRLESQGGN